MAGHTVQIDRTEQDTGEKANRVEEAINKDRVNQQARDETNVLGNGDVSECSGLGPSVAIIFNIWSAQDLASSVKRLNNKIRITLALPNLNSLTEDDKRILQTTEILLVQPSVVRRSPIIYDLPNLKWIQSLGAGIDQLIPNNQNNEPPPSFILTRNVGSFNRQMADFVVTTIIARERHFRDFWENQTRKIWVSGGICPDKGEQRHVTILQDPINPYPLRTPCRPLAEISVGIVGFGNIGKEVARVAKFFGLRVWALVRSLPTEITKSPDVDEYRLVPELGDVLSSCDYVVSVLPSVPSTDGFFDGDTLSKGKTKKPVFMNIGRGNVIRDSTVIHALNEGWITHAILDVFEKEPLPVDSPLWTHPQVSVIPHDSAGGFNDETILRSFLENYERYINGKELLHTVDWKKGY